MTTKVGTISISAVKTPSCTGWSFPSSSFAQGAIEYISVNVKNNSNVTIKLELRSTISDSGDNISWDVNSGFTSVDAGKSITLFNSVKVSDNSSLCYTSWKITSIGIYAKYGTTEYGPFCTQSDRTFTITPDYKGSLGTGHTIPSSAYLGDTVNFTIKGKNTNSCFTYNLWAKVICKLSTDETKTFSGTGSKVSTSPGSTSDLSVSVTVPTDATVGTYNVYAELYASA